MKRLRPFLRTLVSVGLLLAWAMPPLSATIVWGWIFDTQYGVVNHVLSEWFGLPFEGHSWLIDPLSFFFVASIIIVWGAVPFVAFSVYAGLTQVSEEVLEAAQLDGADGFASFRYVVLPVIRPILAIVTILQIIWDLRVFTQIYALQSIGGLAEQTNTLGVYIYRVSLGSGDFGVGGAISVIVVLLLATVSVFYVRRSIKEESL
jgi:N,N'-diacetylchitobiose transport system permease protein